MFVSSINSLFVMQDLKYKYRYSILTSIYFARWFWIPLRRSTAVMEYRILHNIFCEQYHIGRKSFPFDDYIRVSWERYLLGTSSASILYCVHLKTSSYHLCIFNNRAR